MLKVLPLPNLPFMPSSVDMDEAKPPSTLTYWVYSSPKNLALRSNSKQKTRIMATLNVTPDSFSDGSEHDTLCTALSYVEESVVAGADIIDIGGYSTRPGAVFVSVNEETERISPVVRAIRANEATRMIPISVDSFRWEVAEAAILAGVNVINDVYAFTGSKSLPGSWQQDEKALSIMGKMKQLGRKYATPVVLMHSRGDAGQGKCYSSYRYAEKNGTTAVVEGVRTELGDKVERIVKGKGGLRRWLIIVDPGIGFSKTVADNLELLRNGSKVVENTEIGQGKYDVVYTCVYASRIHSNAGNTRRRNPLAGFPTLIGTSRKSFIGSILLEAGKGRETLPRERAWATASAVACAVQQGVMVARVHDVKEMRDVLTMADALWS